MSGKGAHPLGSSWLAEGTGETPGQLVQNLAFAGRVDDLTDDELEGLWARGLASLKARNKTNRSAAYSLQVSIQLAEAADATFASARNALNQSVDPRGEYGLIQKFSPELLEPPTARVLELQGEIADYESLEANYAAALAANPALAALHAQWAAVVDALGKYDSTNPDEETAREANRELVRRGVKKKRVP